MRPKFRGLTIKTGQRADGGLFCIGERAFIVLDDCEILTDTDIGATKLGFYISDFVEVDPATVGQLFEHPDKNGKEIYEKDICKSEDRVSPFVITFVNGAFRGKYISSSGDGFVFDDYEASRSEVIGNTIENPELLNE